MRAKARAYDLTTVPPPPPHPTPPPTHTHPATPLSAQQPSLSGSPRLAGVATGGSSQHDTHAARGARPSKEVRGVLSVRLRRSRSFILRTVPLPSLRSTAPSASGAVSRPPPKLARSLSPSPLGGRPPPLRGASSPPPLLLIARLNDLRLFERLFLRALVLSDRPSLAAPAIGARLTGGSPGPPRTRAGLSPPSSGCGVMLRGSSGVPGTEAAGAGVAVGLAAAARAGDGTAATPSTLAAAVDGPLVAVPAGIGWRAAARR